MPKTATTHARMDPKIKQEAERIIKDMGLSISAAHELFYRKIIAHQGIPFEMRVPNKETLQSMQEAREGVGKSMKQFKTCWMTFRCYPSAPHPGSKKTIYEQYRQKQDERLTGQAKRVAG